MHSSKPIGSAGRAPRLAAMSDDHDNDADMFRRAAGPVRRLHSDRVEHPRRRPKPLRRRHADPAPASRQMLSDADVAPPAEGGLLFARPGVQKKMLRKLRRGQLRIEDELDLHGMRVNEAGDALARFLAECTRRRLRSVRVIHGKGLGSGIGRSVLKENVARWLSLRDEVMAYSSAQPNDGGTGAVYVLLRR